MSIATLPPPTLATIDDLMKHDGKAELIGGRIVAEMPASRGHGRIGGNIFASLHAFGRQRKCGEALPDSTGYRVPKMASGRESFCPDVGYMETVDTDTDDKFVDGPPTFAVEVRSPDQYGRAQDAKMAGKRADYFKAGSLAVWDVDPDAETVTLYAEGKSPTVFRRGEVAHAEPAVPGWTMSVNDIF